MNRPLRPLFSAWQWLTIVGGLVVAGVSVTAFAFSTFETKTDFVEIVSDMRQTMIRIETKLDQALAQQRGR
jgi:hypothetical protein